MASYADLRKKKDPLADMQAKLKSAEKGTNKNELEDDTFWSYNHLRGEDGTGSAVIRLLPAPDGEDDAWVMFHEHIFQGSEHWYVNRSRMTLGSNEKDPVFEFNGKLFRDKSLTEDERKKRLLPRKTNYISNILVVDDPVKPENNGKVFRFKYGPQIYNVIQSAAFPEFGESPIPVFDPLEGANLVIRVYSKKIGRDVLPSYEKSSFQAPSAIVDDINDFDAIWEREFSLQELVAPEKFRPYNELKLRFNLVQGDISQEEYDEAMAALRGEARTTREEKARPSKSEPSKASKAPAVDADEPKSSFKEEIDDEIPFDVDPPKEAAPAASDDDDDWFNQLKR